MKRACRHYNHKVISAPNKIGIDAQLAKWCETCGAIQFIRRDATMAFLRVSEWYRPKGARA